MFFIVQDEDGAPRGVTQILIHTDPDETYECEYDGRGIAMGELFGLFDDGSHHHAFCARHMFADGPAVIWGAPNRLTAWSRVDILHDIVEGSK